MKTINIQSSYQPLERVSLIEWINKHGVSSEADNMCGVMSIND